jgi:hypothetical protein
MMRAEDEEVEAAVVNFPWERTDAQPGFSTYSPFVFFKFQKAEKGKS